MTLARVEQLQQLAEAANLAGIAIMPGPNMAYFTGLSFHLSERPTLAFFPAKGLPVLLVPSLEEAKAQDAPYDVHVFTYTDEAGPEEAFVQTMQALGMSTQTLGIEGRRIRFLELDLMERSGYGPAISNADTIIAELRMHKDSAELAAMRQAVDIAQKALQATLPMVKAGVTEKTIAAELTLQLLRAGSAGELPFAPLVASGPNGANPHAFPSERMLKGGDLIIFDWGAAVDGYFSDITRTFAVAGGDVPTELQRAYQAVQAANAAGRAAAKPGTTGQDVDRATRQVITQAGFGDYFIHRTGHGLGMETHEEPDMKEGSLIPLEPGMTFTVEPGIYLPGVGGIRIEDDMVITTSGAESLTSLSRDWQAMGPV